ncbi:MAG: histidine phosphatase family protein [bacterium]|nr:histidine phosphatase family protein [bacterium]
MNNTRSLIGLIATVLLSALVPDCAHGDAQRATTVIVVRHAEKQQAEDDPGLTLAGEERSHRLRDLTLEAGVTAVFASQFRRTQATVRPLAEALGLEIAIADAGDTPALVTKILSDHRGGIVVVAGHSNTVPGIVAALGAPEPGPIDESDYGNLFIVTVPEDGPASALSLRF